MYEPFRSLPEVDYRQRETSPTSNRDGENPLQFESRPEVKIDRIYLLLGDGGRHLSPSASVAGICAVAALDA